MPSTKREKQMKMIKFCAFASAAMLAGGAFADAANTLISFSTPGPDKYADGTTVIDGESYALVWSKDGNFDGFTADRTAVDENDIVYFVASLAKDGKCPPVVFQIDSAKAKTDGVYEVLLLDTRATVTTLSKTAVNGAVVAKTYSAAGATSVVAENTADNTANGVITATALAASAIKAPVITGIKVEGAQVKITVSDLVPGVKYSVSGGLDRKAAELTAPVFINGDTTFIVDADKAQFFSIKGE